ncbi:phage tail protein [Kosakonia oryzendophytica]|uniref:phage tail protein n=1 Tax=Kosakonia oryzendophytica TaxID=1005665 RepID=UPI003D333FAB
MTAKFFAILTNQGAALLANAAALGTKLNLTQMAVGDGNGTLPTPDAAQTKLVNQKRIAPLNMLSVDPNNASQIIAEQIIPENEGGFWIREIGIYDDNGVLIAVANCPETYKPQLQEGSGRTQTIRMVLIVSSTAAVTLKIDPSVVLATRQYVESNTTEVKAYADDLLKQHNAAGNPHPQYAPLASPALTGTPTTPTPAPGDNSRKIATTEFVQSATAGIVGQSRNAAMNLTAASASVTWSADELITETAPGGQQYRLNGLNLVFNGAVTGAGGMDAGTLPVSGFVALYVIYNPTTGAKALLGFNATGVKASEIYPGGDMPKGYTASALISVLPTNSQALISPFIQIGRSVSIPQQTAVSTTAPPSSLSALNISGIVPKNAVSCSGSVSASTSNTGQTVSGALSGAGIPATIGNKGFGAITMVTAPYCDLSIMTAQTIYWGVNTTGGSLTGALTISEYKL